MAEVSTETTWPDSSSHWIFYNKARLTQTALTYLLFKPIYFLALLLPLQALKNDPSGLSATLMLGSLHFVLSNSSYCKRALGIQAA